MKPFSDGQAANDEFQSANQGLQRGELVRDLLRQRIRCPDLPPDSLTRPDFNTRLGQALGHAGILFLEAPAGFGKSHALNAALAARPEGSPAPRWVSLIGQDNTPVRLLTLLAMAMDLPDALESALQSGASFADALGVLLMAWNRAHGDEQQVLVLDNLQSLTNPAVVSLVQQLANDMPASMALALVSRHGLPFQGHHLELDNRFVRIGPEALAFSRPETFAFFRQSSVSDSLTSVAIDRLYDLTEGWPTPLALYRRELQHHQERRPIQDCPAVERFLKETLLAPLTHPQLRALRRMAELEVASDELFLAVQPDDEDGALIPSDACERGLPVLPVPGRGRWFRMNPLLQEVLRGQRQAGFEQRMVAACRWFARRNQFPEALRYALLAGDGDEVIRIASDSSEALLLGQDTASLLSLRRSLPVTLLDRSVRLRIVYGWVHAIGGQFREARSLIGDLSDTECAENRTRLAALSAFIRRGEGQVWPALADADEALSGGGLSLQGQLVAQMVRASALCAAGQYGEAREANRAAARLAREAGDAGSEALAVYTHARIELGKGALRHAEQLLRTALDTAMQELSRPARIGETRLILNLALVLWHQGRLDEADRLLIHGGRHAEQSRDVGLLLAMALRVLICRTQGQLDDAFVWIGRAERTMHAWQVDEAMFVPVLEALKATCWLAQRQSDSAAHALERLRPYRDSGCVPELFPMMPGLIDCLEVRVHLARGDGVQARKVLSAAAGRHGEAMPRGVMLYTRLLDDLLLAEEKGPSVARRALQQTLDLAASEQFVSPFMELRDELQPWMEKALDPLADSPFKNALTKLFGLRREPATVSGALPEPISDREKGVLELIAQGLSNQEIADKLHISLHTVKTHARRINAKLEVRSRTQAIVRARELGLL